MITRGYLDIETTGLSYKFAQLTVVGIGLERGRMQKCVQLVGEQVSARRILDIIRDANVLYTYNGTRFDLPFVRAKLGIDLEQHVIHEDLMYHCWRKNLYGGLKKVEALLGIERKTKGIDGWMAVKLWYDYVRNANNDALKLLLDYNKEDIMNLAVLRKRLRA